eukprot:3002696-Prymnesium_polylepis.1
MVAREALPAKVGVRLDHLRPRAVALARVNELRLELPHAAHDGRPRVEPARGSLCHARVIGRAVLGVAIDAEVGSPAVGHRVHLKQRRCE